MRLKKKQLARLKDVLEVDRKEKNDDFLSLLEKDLATVFSEYFVYDSKPICKLKREDNKIQVLISLDATNIKIFGVLP